MGWKLKPELKEKHPKVAKYIESALNSGKSKDEAVDEALEKYRHGPDRPTLRDWLRRR